MTRMKLSEFFTLDVNVREPKNSQSSWQNFDEFYLFLNRVVNRLNQLDQEAVDAFNDNPYKSCLNTVVWSTYTDWLLYRLIRWAQGDVRPWLDFQLARPHGVSYDNSLREFMEPSRNTTKVPPSACCIYTKIIFDFEHTLHALTSIIPSLFWCSLKAVHV